MRPGVKVTAVYIVTSFTIGDGGLWTLEAVEGSGGARGQRGRCFPAVDAFGEGLPGSGRLEDVCGYVTYVEVLCRSADGGRDGRVNLIGGGRITDHERRVALESEDVVHVRGGLLVVVKGRCGITLRSEYVGGNKPLQLAALLS